MKKILLITGIIAILLSSCSTPVPRSEAYNGIYKEKPVSVLVMPPINKSTNVEAKEYFYSTLNVPIVNAGYYVYPTFLTMEILKQESAYDSEQFFDKPLKKFGELFGADLVLFTIIHSWDKASIGGYVNVEVEYIFKSTETNEIVYTRRGDISYNTSVSIKTGGLLGVVASITATAIKTATFDYMNIAHVCNSYTFQDLPAGKYSPKFGLDKEEPAGPKTFEVELNEKSD